MNDKRFKNRASEKRLKECDTLIVSSSPKNYMKILLQEEKWYPISISEKRIIQIKFLAIYQSSPISLITSLFKVKSINCYDYKSSDNIWELDVNLIQGNKYCVSVFKDSLIEVSLPFNSKKKAIFGPVFGKSEDILTAKCIEDIFSIEKYL